ncbi:MAG: ABC transporter C-terminal domain-containing protein [Candidatus Microbacterium phytovorans]|uniref:ABC transporter C-terminal domain-containing protein n=1 Tax=Candidatus Microbacterium phytovorans TaxID=3121374 RepID=A0AAJ5W0X1_9MICO|nr:ABC transporter C-terminal domain-containing protein [Microbacterium sp.]WEK13707.1 MAG: ABC transporter C-terminal domain-containing protein [Microbacterium sp.]
MTDPRLDPGAGDPGALRAWAEDRHARAERLARTSTDVVDAIATASGAAWTGAAHDAFVREIDTALPELDVLIDSFRATGDVLAPYADIIDGIKDEQHALTRHRARLIDERDDAVLRWRSATAELHAPEVAFTDAAERTERLHAELRTLDRELEAVEERWDALVVRRRRADADCAAALQSRDVRGALFAALRDGGDARSPRGLLRLLGTLSASDLRALAAAHPDLCDQLLGLPPTEVAAWWAGLAGDPDQQARLIEHLPVVIGALGGLPAAVRIAANRFFAIAYAAFRRRQRREATHRWDRPQGRVPHMPPAPVDAPRLADDRELDYLDRVGRGEVQLYLYRPDQEHIIEVFGDPDTADVLLTFMPGTNTTMDSFYSSTRREGITALTRWQVENPPTNVSVSGLVVKQGDFPQLDDWWSRGPHHNWFARPLGRAYANLTAELDVVTGGKPIVSSEHSFGSAPAGEAEQRGAHFAARYTLAGIGMTAGWEPRDGTRYFAAQGPADINRHLDDHEALGFGYDVTPTAQSGFTEIDTGLPEAGWIGPLSVISPPAATFAGISIGVDQHNKILVADLAANGPVMWSLRQTLKEAAE